MHRAHFKASVGGSSGGRYPAVSAATGLNLPLLACHRQDDSAPAHLAEQAVARLGVLDFVMHAVAWAPLDDLQGRSMDGSADGFARAMDIGCHSSPRLARHCAPRLHAGGGLLTKRYLGASETIPQ